ncbi:DUF4845 domain-containing protein [Hahella ganghwensis]|uniref:DUF4845 domain-containing protein n=1 Tax=Hahella ganghwensis TaxID=286420 RepID=UPI0003821986|nr:DUF4845 domain-containing protein [Hahella ganghwensis]
MRKKQTGASMYVTMLWILIGVSVIYLALKITPIYLDNYTIASALDGLKRETNLAKLTNQEILKRLDKHLVINNVRNFNKENVEIVREKTSVSINIDYEVRTNIIKNIDAVVSFENRLEVNNQ